MKFISYKILIVSFVLTLGVLLVPQVQTSIAQSGGCMSKFDADGLEAISNPFGGDNLGPIDYCCTGYVIRVDNYRTNTTDWLTLDGAVTTVCDYGQVATAGVKILGTGTDLGVCFDAEDYCESFYTTDGLIDIVGTSE